VTTPEIATQPDVPETPTVDDDDAPSGPENVAEVELGEDDYGGDNLFDDVEDAESDSSGSTPGESSDVMDSLDAATGGLSSAMNEGAARLAVVGLDDDEKEELEQEFTEVFSAFRLGHYAGRCAEEYVLADTDEEVDPAWGLLGSVLVCSAVVVWMRPDGDEQIQQLKQALGGGDE
jgi:hypothetical protein